MKKVILCSLAFALNLSIVFAQDFKTAVGYLNSLGTEFKAIQSATWDYTKAAANNKIGRKIDKRRKELVLQIDGSTQNVRKMPAFNEKTYLKDSVLTFLKMQKHVVNEDYAKLMDLEEVAESSYDAMEAYFKAKDIASEKLKKSSEMVNTTYKSFAKEHNITLIDGDDDKITKQLLIADEVYSYYNTLYLLFFKAYKQELYFLSALETGDIAALEQNKVSLSSVSEECLNKLKVIKAFRGSDQSMLKAAIDITNFFKMESNTKFAKLIEFHTKSLVFEKAKKAFEANKNRSNDDINTYNKLIEEANKSAIEYNAINQELFKTRSKLLNDWNNNSQNFTAKYL